MMTFKSRKALFSLLLALFAGGSLAAYSSSEANFMLKTIELLVIQQIGAAIIYLACFAPDLLRPSSSRKESPLKSN
ncbi:hypothetical protein [Myxacorys almedinensis]|uniref:Uncharacterized protein n=1 Tax=Myxacorys almedinensis A TaxID=2690445 RepID=A0A8J8CGI1_9CYAN|nr:hypothetical protein [Myxacorys almedinensis]NDJ15768.1 hypothetical protein [Myxacorys almedinensis A]